MASGELETDSPSVNGLARRNLSPSDYEAFRAAYATACASGGLSEAPVVREPGVSFNPRPARLCHILLTEGAVRDLPTLVAALSRCVPAGQPPAVPDGADLAAAELAEMLDSVRHLHMTDLSADGRAAVIAEAQKLLAGSDRERYQRLYSLLDAAISRARRM